MSHESKTLTFDTASGDKLLGFLLSIFVCMEKSSYLFFYIFFLVLFTLILSASVKGKNVFPSSFLMHISAFFFF